LIPRDQFLSAMSLMSLAGLIGPLIGPTLGGWLVEVATWHWIFLINLPMGLLGILVTLKALPNATEPSVKTFDLSGFLWLVVAMVGLGLISTAIYAYHAHTHENALFRSRLFQNKIYAIGILGNFFARLGGNALPFLLPLMLQVAFHFEPFVTGLLMIPAVLGSLASKPLVRPVIQKLGYRRVLIINTLLVGSCIASFALTTADTPLWLRTLHFFIFGILNSTQFVAMNTFTLKDLSQQNASSGNSFLSMIMMLSMSIGVALAGTLVNLFTAHYGVEQVTTAFHLTLICLGAINIITAAVFWQIPKNSTL